MRRHERRGKGHRTIVPRAGKIPPRPLLPTDIDRFPSPRVNVEAAGDSEGSQGAPWLRQVDCYRQAGLITEGVVAQV